MDAWIPITLAAAFLQNLRSALQKHLKGRLSTTGATFARFAYAAPLAALYAAGLAILGGYPVPEPNPTFALYVLVGGLFQIFGTALLVHLFSLRNFAVGTTFSKTETMQTAIFGILILGDPLSLGAASAILISLVGVMTISVARTDLSFFRLLTGWAEKPALIGIASGACFGISAVSYRGASLSLGGEGFLMQAAFTLVCVTSFQTVVMAAWMRLREPGQLTAVARSWRVSAWVSLSGMLASACWFTAMTIQNAAYVRALGQVELLFTFAAAHLFFRERSNASRADRDRADRRRHPPSAAASLSGPLPPRHCRARRCPRQRSSVRRATSVAKTRQAVHVSLPGGGIRFQSKRGVGGSGRASRRAAASIGILADRDLVRRRSSQNPLEFGWR